jgi:hypothetical protein
MSSKQKSKSSSNLASSKIETSILNSTTPISLIEEEEICANGEKGVWANKSEVVNWTGPIPISEYSINQDPDPIIIKKKSNKKLDLKQKVFIRYLQPPTPTPGEIIIKQEPDKIIPPEPPLIIRQQPPMAPPPMVYQDRWLPYINTPNCQNPVAFANNSFNAPPANISFFPNNQDYSINFPRPFSSNLYKNNFFPYGF